MTEYTDETLEMTEQDKADLEALNAEPPQFHPILEVWQEVLRPAASEALKRVTPGWASTITSKHPAIKLQEMNTFRDIYFGKIEELRAILEYEIDSDPKCLQAIDAAEDREENSVHYHNLIVNWQLAIQQWEIDWDCTSVDAHLQLAAFSEVHNMFLGGGGLLAHLELIGFQFTEDDQIELAAALQAHRGEHE